MLVVGSPLSLFIFYFSAGNRLPFPHLPCLGVSLILEGEAAPGLPRYGLGSETLGGEESLP